MIIFSNLLGGIINRNQLKSANYNYWNGSGWSNSSAYDLSSVSYDKDGKVQVLNRTNGSETVQFDYEYKTGTNKIDYIVDWANQETYQFGWDSNGNMTSLEAQYGDTLYNITSTTYSWRNQPLSITRSGTTYNYRYDHAGLRVYKQEGDNIHTLLGAFGEVLATYKNGSLDYWNIVRPDGALIGSTSPLSGSYRHYSTSFTLLKGHY